MVLTLNCDTSERMISLHVDLVDLISFWSQQLKLFVSFGFSILLQWSRQPEDSLVIVVVVPFIFW